MLSSALHIRISVLLSWRLWADIVGKFTGNLKRYLQMQFDLLTMGCLLFSLGNLIWDLLT